MATISSLKRSAKCLQCGTDSIFPRWSKGQRAGQAAFIFHCPVCEHKINMTDKIIEKTSSEAERIEEFFSRFC